MVRIKGAILAYQSAVKKSGVIAGRVDINGATHKLLIKNARRKRPPHVKKFIQRLLKPAVKISKKYKIPVSVIIAQPAVETEWGKKVKDNAYFGVKSHNSNGPSTTFTTHEHLKNKKGIKTKVKIKDKFRAYKNIGEAAEDYGKFLTTNKRYKSCFAFSKQPYKFAEKVASAPYATDPLYGQKLKAIIKYQYLTDFDRTGLPREYP